MPPFRCMQSQSFQRRHRTACSRALILKADAVPFIYTGYTATVSQHDFSCILSFDYVQTNSSVLDNVNQHYSATLYGNQSQMLTRRFIWLGAIDEECNGKRYLKEFVRFIS